MYPRVCRPWSVELASLAGAVPFILGLGLSGDAQIYRPTFFPLTLLKGGVLPVALSFKLKCFGAWKRQGSSVA